MHLILNTAHATCGVGLFYKNDVLAQREVSLAQGHAQILPLMVEEVLAESGKKPQDLSVLIVDVGPGSFTGIRVGVAFAKGFAQGFNIPLNGINAFDIFHAGVEPCCDSLVVIDAKRKDLYCQFFPACGDPFPPQNLTPKEVEKLFDLQSVTCCGDGVFQLEETLKISLTTPQPALSRIALMHKAFVAGKAHSPATPFYLRSADVSFPH